MGDAIREQVKTYRDVDVSNSKPTGKARVWVNTASNDSESQDILLPQVDDNNVSDENTWSSKKIDSEIGEVREGLEENTCYQNNWVDHTNDYIMSNGFYNRSTGQFMAYEHCESTPQQLVSEGDKFCVTLSYALDTCGIVEYDDSNNVLRTLLCDTDETREEYHIVHDYVYTVPKGVSKIAFSSFPISGADNDKLQKLIIKRLKTVKDELLFKSNASLYGKSMFYDGDSIAYGVDNGVGFGDLLAKKYNMTYDKFAISGATIANYQNGTRHNISTSVCTNMNKQYDIALLEGGYNDFGNGITIGKLPDSQYPYSSNPDDTTVVGAMEKMFQYIQKNYPRTKIYFLMIHKVNRTFVKPEASGYTFFDYYNAIINVCERYGVEVIDLFKNSGFVTYFDEHKLFTVNNDGLHPTVDGYNTFYIPYIEKQLN